MFGTILGTLGTIQGTLAAFREHLAAFREHLAAFREHLAAFREHLAAFREHLAAFREHLLTWNMLRERKWKSSPSFSPSLGSRVVDPIANPKVSGNSSISFTMRVRRPAARGPATTSGRMKGGTTCHTNQVAR